jgi:hypothetical protein
MEMVRWSLAGAATGTYNTQRHDNTPFDVIKDARHSIVVDPASRKHHPGRTHPPAPSKRVSRLRVQHDSQGESRVLGIKCHSRWWCMRCGLIGPLWRNNWGTGSGTTTRIHVCFALALEKTCATSIAGCFGTTWITLTTYARSRCRARIVNIFSVRGHVRLPLGPRGPRVGPRSPRGLNTRS